MFEVIIQILMITVLMVQLVAMIYLLISTIKRDIENKKFWKRMQENVEKELQKYNLEEDKEDGNR